MKIVIDTREQAPFPFSGEQYRGTETAFGTLDTGDYSLAGLTDKVAVERKSLPDLVACTDSMVFVYSSRGFLRSWSVCGLQKSVLTPCNRVVTMVGDAERLALVFEDSLPINGFFLMGFG